MSPDDAVRLAIDVAEDGLQHGEMPIGAVVLQGDKVIGRGYTQEQKLRRRIVHADLMAMLEADAILGFKRSSEPLTLVVNLEPCMMCLGAAITLGINRVWYGLESPNDGGVELLRQWHPPVEQPFFAKPTEIKGGLLRPEIQDQFARYAATETAPKGMRAWAKELSELGFVS